MNAIKQFITLTPRLQGTEVLMSYILRNSHDTVGSKRRGGSGRKNHFFNPSLDHWLGMFKLVIWYRPLRYDLDGASVNVDGVGDRAEIIHSKQTYDIFDTKEDEDLGTYGQAIVNTGQKALHPRSIGGPWTGMNE